MPRVRYRDYDGKDPRWGGEEKSLRRVVAASSDNIDPQLMEYECQPVVSMSQTANPSNSDLSPATSTSYIEPTSFQQIQALYDTSLKFSSRLNEFAEKLDDHIAVLAATKGWDAVQSSVQLDPQWRIIATIDHYHVGMRPIDRLGVIRLLRMMVKV